MENFKVLWKKLYMEKNWPSRSEMDKSLKWFKKDSLKSAKKLLEEISFNQLCFVDTSQ